MNKIKKMGHSLHIANILFIFLTCFTINFVISNCSDETTPDIDIGEITNFVANPVSSIQIDLSWSNPSDSTFAGVLIIRDISNISDNPTDGTTYSAGDMLGDAEIIYNSTGTSYNDVELNADTTYYYKAFAYNTANNYADGINANAATLLAGPELDSWDNTTPLSVARKQHTSVIHNGYVYVIGGVNSGTSMTSVEYASIGTDGTVDDWNTGPLLPDARQQHTSVVYNDYLYVIGGTDNDSSPFNTVYYSYINSDGTIDSWSSTTGFITACMQHTSVNYNGYLYVIGGVDNEGSELNSIQYAPINSDGTIDTWSSTTGFTTARQQHTSVVYNGYLYIIGGYSGGSIDDVEYAPINSNGTIDADSWESTTQTTTPRHEHTSVVFNGHVYFIGGYQFTTYNDVYYALINTDGTIGTWNSTTVFTTALQQHTSVVYNGYVYILAGENEFSNAISDVRYAPFSP